MPPAAPRAPGLLVAALFVVQGATAAPATAQEAERPSDTVDAATLDARRTAANTLLSLALPGAGQLRDGKARGWAYLALEAAAWTAWAERRHRGAELRTRYRDLAWEEGRLQTGSRVDGDFTYYETLASWTRSGAFDADPARSGLQPEDDDRTYNGSIWALARGLFLPGGGADPRSEQYRRALDYYEERAYGEAFLWDWSGDPEGQERLARLIEESDDRYRQATLVLGAVLANHLASAVDAYLFTRLDIRQTSLRIRPVASGLGPAWSLSLHIGALP